MPRTQARGVRVIRVPEQRHVGEVLGDVVRVDAGDIGDHQVRRLDTRSRGKTVAGKQALQLAADEEIDPQEQDRCHAS